jgi:hypothetical protein
MDPELRLLNLVRRDWWALLIVLCTIWAIECHLEGNSILETVEAPLLLCVYLGAVVLLDRWVQWMAGTIGIDRGARVG